MPSYSKYRQRDFSYSVWTATEHSKLGRYLPRRRGNLQIEEPECMRHQRKTQEILKARGQLQD